MTEPANGAAAEPRRDMNLGLHLNDFAWPVAADHLDSTVTEIAQAGEAAGFTTIAVMDHVWQYPYGGGEPEGPVLEGYTTLGYLAGLTSRVTLLPAIINDTPSAWSRGMETMKVIARNTTEHHGKSGLLRDVPVSREIETAWVLAAQLALRSTRHSTVLTPTQHDRAGPKGTTTEALTALTAAAVAASVAAERVVSLAAVLDEALAVLADARRAHPAVPPSLEPAPGAAMLSPREWQVLELVAAGHTNKAIADILFVSPNTIKTHVASLLTKMDADSRVQLAAIAARKGLG